MIRVITIDREYGSGGAEIARRVAERLHWKLWDQLLTNEVARRMECDCKVVEQHEEKKDPLFYRLAKAFLRGSYEGSLNAPRLNLADTDCIREASAKVVKEAADEGQCVIVGRGSAYYLQNRMDAFHVFIYAPHDEKVARLEAGGKTHDEALSLAETVDRDRAAFIKRYFNVDWPCRDCFHLMINTTIGDDTAVDTILDSVARLERREPGALGAAPQKSGTA
jgi:cytidylate kinase